jgi:hypothetical protein
MGGNFIVAWKGGRWSLVVGRWQNPLSSVVGGSVDGFLVRQDHRHCRLDGKLRLSTTRPAHYLIAIE